MATETRDGLRYYTYPDGSEMRLYRMPVEIVVPLRVAPGFDPAALTTDQRDRIVRAIAAVLGEDNGGDAEIAASAIGPLLVCAPMPSRYGADDVRLTPEEIYSWEGYTETDALDVR